MSSASPVRRIAKTLAPIIAIVLLWLLFFWRVITPAQADRLTFQQGDFTLQFLAYRQLAFNQLSQGRFPSIEECLYSGHPFQADPQSQVLYPPVLAIMLIGRALGWTEYPLRALEWEVMLHVLLAALAMYAFLRSNPHPTFPRVRGSTKVGAVFGAVAFAFGGFMTGYAMLQTAILETAAWLPLILLAVRWLATARRWWPAAALVAVLVFFAFTAGHPQTLLFSVNAGAIAFVWWSLNRPDRSSRPVRSLITRALVAGALAIGLCAIQLLPTLSFMLASTRASLPFEQAGRGFTLHDISLFALAGVTNVWQPLFVGISALAMAVVALFAAPRPPKNLAGFKDLSGLRRFDDTWLWVIIGIGALALSFGANALGFDLAYLIAPGYRQFQSQERHAVIVALCLGVLAAYGLNALLRPMRRRARLQLRKTAKWLALWSMIAFAAMLAVLLAGHALPQNNLGDAADKVALITMGLLGTAGLFAWRVRLAKLTGFTPSLRFGLSALTPRTLWGMAALALLVFELFTANRSAALQTPADPFPPNALITPIQQDATYASQFARVYNHFGLPLNGACVRGLNEVAGGSPIVMRDYKAFLEHAPEDVMIKLLNVRHAVTWRGAMTTPEGKEIPWFLLGRDTFEGKEASTYRLDWDPKNFNGAWIARDVQSMSDDAMYEAMRKEGFDPFTTAFVPSSPSPTNPLPLGEGSSAIEGKAPGYIKVAANANAPALLVLSEAYHWNWTARVNGNEVKPIVVDGALLGMSIPTGASSIELSYRPTELIAGAAISTLTLLFIIVALIASRRSAA